MPKIQPISDLRNYPSILENVTQDSPVFLTKNGRGMYVIMNIETMEKYEKLESSLKLMCELQDGRLAGESKGWLTENEIKEHFAGKNKL